ncbi:MAG: signal recognition particle-docking protein FtsY [Rhodospirillaceae bacterium]|nr:signal recognition particle-docking protein FtsY [Rhodospirillaceae bacterium]
MSWLEKLKKGLGRSSAQITDGIGNLFTAKRKLDDGLLDELEEILIASDMGATTAAMVINELRRTRFNKEINAAEVRQALATEIEKILDPVTVPLKIDSTLRPHVILVCGVNGAGKTTTIGKLAKQFTGAGKNVMIAAGDTFRAAAIEQLQVWGERTGSTVVASTIGSDAASLAFDAMTQAKEKNIDILLIDTAGRLQNKTDLMAELEKIVRVIKKIDETAPHDVLLVLDATVGQNAHAQVETFKQMVGVSGLVMTKLDGTAKGGVVVALADRFKLPVHALGIGEGVDDLKEFTASDFAKNLMGLE